jgi:hypothetical protein
MAGKQTTLEEKVAAARGMDAETKATVALARVMGSPDLDAAARERVMRNAWARWGPKEQEPESEATPAGNGEASPAA